MCIDNIANDKQKKRIFLLYPSHMINKKLTNRKQNKSKVF